MSSPRITFLIKGQVNSGKSTLLNAIFARYLSTVSIQGLPNTLISVTDAHHNDEEEVDVRNKIVSAAQAENALTPVQCRIAAKDALFPKIEGLEYNFIDTAGFGTDDVDKSTAAWFRSNIASADALLFVTDKSQCMNTVAEKRLLSDTLADLRRVQHVKQIPLIILINKVDYADSSVDEVVQRCREHVNAEIEKHNCKFQVAFCKVSMMNIFLLRTFIANNYSFAGLQQGDIDQLCGDQLGSLGRQQAHDLSRHEALAAQIRSNISCSSDNWRDSTGLRKLGEIMQEIVFNKSTLEHMLVSQLNAASCRLRQVNDALGMQQLVMMFHEYSRCIEAVRSHPEIPSLEASSVLSVAMDTSEQDVVVLDDDISILQSQPQIHYITLSDQHNQYQEIYIDGITRLLETYARDPQSDCKDFLMDHLQSFYDHEDIDQHALFTATEWENKVRCAFIRHMFELCWALPGVKPPFGGGTYFPRPDVLLTSEQLVKNTDLMLKCIFCIQERWTPLFQMICSVILPAFVSDIPIKLRCVKLRLANPDSTTFIHYLEDKLLSNINTRNIVARHLLIALVKAKIMVRESIPSYSVFLVELLNEHTSLKKEFFQLFFTVLHSPLPVNDIRFCEDLLLHSDESRSYQKFVLGSDLMVAERHLLREVCGEDVNDSKKRRTDTSTPMNGHSSGYGTPSRKRLVSAFGQC